MNTNIKNYIVSSADWEFEVDDTNPKRAVMSALLLAFNKFKNKLKVSTVIMVNDKYFNDLDLVEEAEFYPTYEILNSIGLNQLSKQFEIFTKHES
jgi:hypothetical protein